MAKEENYQITKNLNEKKLREFCSFFNNRNLKELELKEGEMEILIKSTSLSDETSPEKPSPVLSNSTKLKEVSTTKQPQEGNPIVAPISGNFYAAPSPNDPPYVKIGDKIKKGDKIGIIEAMKVMNEIASTHSGILISILVEDGKPVKQGNTLMIIK